MTRQYNKLKLTYMVGSSTTKTENIDVDTVQETIVQHG